MPLARNQSAPVIVAGGAGFLGSHLCERLVDNGLAVICIDNLVTGDAANIEALRQNASFHFRRHDVSVPLALSGVRAVVNLACPASPVHYQADPIRTTMTSVFGTYNLLEIARLNSVPLLQASTSEVYGDPAIHPQSETYWGHVNPTGLRSCYDEGKRCAESLCFDYSRTHSMDVRVVRIFNTYGPRMQVGDGRVVSNFIVQALRNQPITIYGDGHQTRSFCFVDDLVEGLVRFLLSPKPLQSPMNLGNPEEFTILELAELVIELTGSRSGLTFLPLPSDDPMQRCPDIGLAKRQLAWAPRTQLRAGLLATISYFDRVLRAAALSTAAALSSAAALGAPPSQVARSHELRKSAPLSQEPPLCLPGALEVSHVRR
ncbi:MAG: SDR family oxidoreductase [Sinobacteraceae bacterium]|nr:SDR family oxidoreductase [Nevskiaceae bacterium]